MNRVGTLRGGRGREGQRFTCSHLLRRFRQSGSLLSLYFYTVSRNTSSAFHFISIPTPGEQFAFCRFYLFFSFLLMPLHFLNDNKLAISTLEMHRPEHDAGCIQNRGTIFSCIEFLTVSLSLQPESRSTAQISCNNPLNLLIESRSLPSDPYKPLAGLGTPRGTEGRSYVSPLNSNKWTRGSMASLIGCHEICSIRAPQCNNPLF